MPNGIRWGLGELGAAARATYRHVEEAMGPLAAGSPVGLEGTTRSLTCLEGALCLLRKIADDVEALAAIPPEGRPVPEPGFLFDSEEGRDALRGIEERLARLDAKLNQIEAGIDGLPSPAGGPR